MEKPERLVSLKVVLVVVLVTAAGTSAATTVLVRNPATIVPATGTVQVDDDLTIDSQQLSYEGINVTGATVVVNNTGASEHTGTVHVRLVDDGATLATETTSETTFAAGATKSVDVSFGGNYSVANVTGIEVVVQRTG
ncbi:hypothetical protein [Halogeometricum limi]|uniref:CARDB protein n=1 Tax=Halogeometricum limi TaxID=555875 RepID=A0A1I6FUI5_9EURY|nr:hypothetical protein [Halogeometricum limi]SFR33477.1 hypothetical protein SAMN04488124_0309 [Halogeometricum limi]